MLRVQGSYSVSFLVTTQFPGNRFPLILNGGGLLLLLLLLPLWSSYSRSCFGFALAAAALGDAPTFALTPALALAFALAVTVLLGYLEPRTPQFRIGCKGQRMISGGFAPICVNY